MGARFRLSELAEEIGVDADTLGEDLVALSMCGVPPYTPESLIGLYIEDDEAIVWSDPPAPTGDIRLTREETEALSTALCAAGVASDHPLLQTLASAAGPADSATEIEARIVAHAGSALAALASALDGSRAVRITYLAAGSQEISERVVEPWALNEHGGVWYLTGYCRRVGEERVFRVDRVQEAVVLDETFTPPADVRAYEPGDIASEESPRARIRLAPGCAFPLDEWPGSSVADGPDGSSIVELPVSDPRRVARLVASFLGDATVLEPEWLKDTTRTVANNLLAGM